MDKTKFPFTALDIIVGIVLSTKKHAQDVKLDQEDFYKTDNVFLIVQMVIGETWEQVIRFVLRA